ncbi:MAG: MAPEG family protein [Nitratireductor sp.]
MSLQITAIYSAILAVMMIGLSTWVTLLRAKLKISILHGDSVALAERIRMHGNFIETVPMALIVMGLAEAGGASSSWLNAIGVLLVAGRILHPLGIDSEKPANPLRIVGGSLTTLAMLIGVFLIAASAIAR